METILSDTKIKSLRDASMVFIDNEVVVLEELKADFYCNEVDLSSIYFTNRYEELFEIITKNKIDIIVSDFKMPEKNGIDILEHIRKENRSIVLVLRTGYTISFESQERERCDAANIKILFKHDGFEHMCANLGNYLNEKSSSFEVESKNEKKDTKIEIKPLFSSSLPRIARYISSILMFEDEGKTEITYNKDENWDRITEVPTKILKILHDKVQCECLINSSLKKTQIREFPLVLFLNIKDFREDMFVQVKTKLKPGFSCTEILDGSDLNYENYFDIENLDDLNDFETVKLV